MSDWIPFADARMLLADHLFGKSESDYLEAMRSAHRLIIRALIEGELPSRTNDPERFVLQFTTATESQNLALDLDGRLPPVNFWEHWRQAEEIAARAFPPGTGRSRATSAGGDFDFLLADLRDGGTLHGFAPGVELKRDRLPGGLPKPKGRPRGTTMEPQDAPVVQACDEAIRGGMSQAEAVKQFAPKMPGDNTPVSSKATRLRRRLRELNTADKK